MGKWGVNHVRLNSEAALGNKTSAPAAVTESATAVNVEWRKHPEVIHQRADSFNLLRKRFRVAHQ